MTIQVEVTQAPSLRLPEIVQKVDRPVTPEHTRNITRITLLARKYVKETLSPEEEARLVIATEQVRQLMPRITVANLEKLEELGSEIAELQSYDEEVRHKLNQTD